MGLSRKEQKEILAKKLKEQQEYWEAREEGQSILAPSGGTNGEAVRNSGLKPDDLAPVRPVNLLQSYGPGEMGFPMMPSDQYFAMQQKMAEEAKKRKEKTMQLFQKGAFSDGFQLMDIPKVILGTAADAGLNALQGLAGMAEGLWDAGQYGLAGLEDALGFQEDAEKRRKSASRNATEGGFDGAKTWLDQYSVLGKTSEAVGQGLGQMAVIMATGGAGSAAGLGAKGVTALTTGLMGASSFGSSTSEAYQSGAKPGEAEGYGAIAGAADALTEWMFSGFGKSVKAMGLSKSGIPLDDMLAKKVSQKFQSQIAKNLAEYGIKSGAEGTEEVMAGIAQAIGKKMTYMKEEDFLKILEDEQLLEQFVVGSVNSGMMQSGYIPGTKNGSLRQANQAGVDFITGMTANEQAVVDLETKKRIAEAEKDGKSLSKKDKGKIQEQVERDLERGEISTDTIEEVLGGETYQQYKKTADQEDSLRKEFDQLNQMKQGDMTGEQIDRRNELKKKLAELEKTSQRQHLKDKLGQEVRQAAEADRLGETYLERDRRGEAFQADAKKYSGKQAEVVQKAVDSGLLNNTRKTHDFVDLVAKIASEQNVSFDFSNNEKLKQSGFAVEGKIINGVITKEGITLNVQSKKALNQVVGHEIAHVLEGSELYQPLQEVIFQYAKQKGDFQSHMDEISEIYKNVKDADVTAELTADLVGEYLFTDTDFIRQLSTENRNVFQRIYDEVKHLATLATAGSQEARELEKVKRAFDKAYRESGRKPTTESKEESPTTATTQNAIGDIQGDSSSQDSIVQSGEDVNPSGGNVKPAAQFSIGNIVGSNQTNYGQGVYLDSTRLDGLSQDDRVKTMKGIIKQMGGQTFQAYDPKGNAVPISIAKHNERFINQNGKKRPVNNDLAKKYQNDAIKQESIVLIDELISTAEAKGSLPPKYPHGWVDNGGKNPWEYWKTHVLDKNNTIWEVTLNVANSADGRKLLYDIGPIKKKTTGGAANRFPHIPTGGKTSLSQEGGNVKGNASYSSGNFQGKAGSGDVFGKDIELEAPAARAEETGTTGERPASIPVRQDGVELEGGQQGGEKPHPLEGVPIRQDVQQSLGTEVKPEKAGTVEQSVGTEPAGTMEGVPIRQDIVNMGDNGPAKDAGELFPDNFTATQVQMEARLRQVMDGMDRATARGDLHALDILEEEYHQLQNAFIRAYQEEQAFEAGRLDSLEGSVPPPQQSLAAGSPANNQAADPFAERDIQDVGSRSVKAYQYENPAVTPFFQDAALGMLNDLQESMKGERVFNDQVYYESGGEAGWSGTKRVTTDDIAELLDQWHYTYEQIAEGLQDIIQDHGRENNAVSKRIEFMLNDRLKDGYTTVWGEEIPPNPEYLEFLKEEAVQEYSREAFQAFLETADRYAPPPGPVQNMPNMETALGGKGIAEGQQTFVTTEEKLKNRPAAQGVAVEELGPVQEVEGKQKNPDGQQAFMEDAGVDDRIARQQLHQGIVDRIKDTFREKGFDFDEVLKKAKNMATFRTVDNTPQRVMEKTLGYAEGNILSDLTVNKVAQNESDGIRWLNGYLGKGGVLRKIAADHHIKPGSKESAAAQMYAEGFYVGKNQEIISYGDLELAADFPDKQVQRNIKALAQDPRIRQIYDETLQAINESRKRNLYPEIPRLDNYFLHFRAMDDTFSALGLPFNPNDIKAKDLPTDLNGVTADLKPGQPYFASAMHRMGKRTSFDLLGGLERYLTSAKNQIYHIDDIQTLRALRNYIAETYGQATGLAGLDGMSAEEVGDKIRKVYNSHLSTFAKFLNEEANTLAGKTALIDRGLEGIVGRRGITFLNDLNRQVGSNMVGWNVGSALTNTLAGVQAFAKTNKTAFVQGFTQTVADRINHIYGRSDGFAESNPTILRRKGAERFYRTPWQKATDAGYVFAGLVDDFTTEVIVRSKVNELTQKGMSRDKAIVEADKWTSRLMGDRSLGQQPQLYNSKLLGMFTKFQLEVRNQLDSMIYDTVQEAKTDYQHITDQRKRNAKAAAKAASVMFQLAAGQHLFGKGFEAVAGYNPAFDIIEVLMTALGFDDEEDSEDTALDNLGQGALALVEDMPYSSMLTGGRIPMASALPIRELMTGKDDYGRKIDFGSTLAEAAHYALLPGGYGQAKKTYGGLKMFDEDLPMAGSYTNNGDLRFPVEETPLNVAQAAVFGQWANPNAREYFDQGWAPMKPHEVQEFQDLGIPMRDYQKIREDIGRAKDKTKEAEKGQTLSDKAAYVGELSISDAQKSLIINNRSDRENPIDMRKYKIYADLEEMDFATKQPRKYRMLKLADVEFSDYQKYKEAWEDMDEWYDKADYIARLPIPLKQRNAIINTISSREAPIDLTGYENYPGYEAFDYAKSKPGKYLVSVAAASDLDTYKGYTKELNSFKGTQDENGDWIPNSKKRKIGAYIDSLNIGTGQKMILYKEMYKSDHRYDDSIFDYVNGLQSMKAAQKVELLEYLGFQFDEDGYWIN